MRRAPKRFSKINLEISNICNLNCSFCPEVVRSQGMMDVDLFRQIIAQIAPLTEQVCFHLMGDPLVHPRLREFAEICTEWGARVFLVTNGTLLRDRQAEALLHPAFRQICFSLHSFRDNFPDRDPTNYLESIFGFTERALQERPDLFINYRLWNLSDPRGTGPQNEELLRRVEARFGFSVDSNVDVRRSKGQRIRERLFLHFDTEFVWPALDLPILGEQGRCHGLSSHFGILVDGTVVPCCLDKEGAIPLGNVRDAPIEDILDSPRARAMLEGFRRRKLVEDLCQRCQYIKRFTPKEKARVASRPGLSPSV